MRSIIFFGVVFLLVWATGISARETLAGDVAITVTPGGAAAPAPAHPLAGTVTDGQGTPLTGVAIQAWPTEMPVALRTPDPAWPRRMIRAHSPLPRRRRAYGIRWPSGNRASRCITWMPCPMIAHSPSNSRLR